MKVIVFGASQGVGRLVAAEALRRDHTVTAFGVSSPTADRPGPGDDGWRAAPGGLDDRLAVTDAVAEQDAVLFAVEPDGSRGDRQSPSLAMRTVLRAMSDNGVRRLVCLSMGGPGSERDAAGSGLLGRLFKAAPPPDALAEARQIEVAVRTSGLDWTIVRPARLVDDAGQHSWRVGPGYAVPQGKRIARADVAEFMLDQLDDGTNVGHAVAVAW
ncbi:MAG TPA: NAD(P)-binding oxidoreductase [Thermoleophilia bacterium]|nr:NAD(P)-binding oxidoreductase [Thermoleophilia bacterium]